VSSQYAVHQLLLIERSDPYQCCTLWRWLLMRLTWTGASRCVMFRLMNLRLRSTLHLAMHDLIHHLSWNSSTAFIIWNRSV